MCCSGSGRRHAREATTVHPEARTASAVSSSATAITAARSYQISRRAGLMVAQVMFGAEAQRVQRLRILLVPISALRRTKKLGGRIDVARPSPAHALPHPQLAAQATELS